MMDLDELRSAQSRERQASQLQHLRDGFYEEAASFIRGLRTERKRATERSTYDFPYDDPEVQRLTNEIGTAEEVVESLYERRVGKVVKMASFDAAGMAVDAEGLTAEESDLFERLVGDIEANRARVLDALAGGGGTDDTDGSASPTPRSADEAAGTPAPSTDGRDGGVPSADAQQATPDEGAEAPDEPVHIGSGPAADGPVSTADDGARDAERTPEPAAGGGTEGPPEAAHEGSAGGGRGPPPTTDDGMDAASAMGGESAGRSDEVPGGVPDGDASSGAPDSGSEPGGAAETTAAPEAAGASGTEADASAGDHQPVPPAEGPPGAGGESRPATDPSSGDTGTDSPGNGVTTADATGSTTESTTTPDAAATGTDTTDVGDRPADPAAAPPDAGGSNEARSTPDEAATGTLVRVTTDVGEIFGVDGRSYDLATGDVVVLPPDNAAVLVEDGDAERLQSAIPFSNRS
jgi:DNA replication factor GINS